MFIVVTLFVMGVNNFVVFFLRHKDKSPFYLGVFCFLLSINTLLSATGNRYILDSFPWNDGFLMRKLDVVTIILSIPCFLMFLHDFFALKDKHFFLKLFQVIALLFLILVVVSTSQSIDFVFKCYFPVILASIVYSLFVCMRAVGKRERDSLGILVGILILSIAGVNDVMWGYGLLPTRIIVPQATLVFVLVYSFLIFKRFAQAFAAAEQLSVELIENARLRTEMQRRQKQEEILQQLQRRLTGLLHSIDEPLCTVSEAGTIEFCNRAFEEMSGILFAQLAGKPFNESLYIKSHFGEMITLPLEVDDEQLTVYLFKPEGYDAAKRRSVVAFIEELNKNRQRIQSLENLLVQTSPEIVTSNPKLSHELDMIDTALARMGSLLTDNKEIEKKIQLGSELLNLSILYWTQCTGSTKFDLAAESGLWKVNINPDGWERTQTLDRYLEPKTFPKNPRWGNVFKTADFVLIRCTIKNNLREQLEAVLHSLQEMV